MLTASFFYVSSGHKILISLPQRSAIVNFLLNITRNRPNRN